MEADAYPITERVSDDVSFLSLIDALQKQVAALETSLQSVCCAIGGEQTALEEVHGTVQESITRHFAYENLERSLRDNSLHDRIERLEHFKGNSHESEAGQARNRLDTLKQQLADTMLFERVSSLEDSLEQHTKALAETNVITCQIQLRLVACEQRVVAANDAEMPDVEAIALKVASALPHNFADIDGSLLSAVERHEIELSALKIALSQKPSDVDVVSVVIEQSNESVAVTSSEVVRLGNQMESLEKALQVATGKFESDVEVAHERLDKLAAADQMAHQACLQERLGRVEIVLRDYLASVIDDRKFSPSKGDHTEVRPRKELRFASEVQPTSGLALQDSESNHGADPDGSHGLRAPAGARPQNELRIASDAKTGHALQGSMGTEPIERSLASAIGTSPSTSGGGLTPLAAARPQNELRFGSDTRSGLVPILQPSPYGESSPNSFASINGSSPLGGERVAPAANSAMIDSASGLLGRPPGRPVGLRACMK